MKLLAPNGKPSNLTPEQYKLVRTKAFKKWFGDWEKSPKNSSKVVDSNGEPLVVYHGSIKKTFNKFDKKKQGNYVGREFVVGFYFSNNPLIAQTYTYEPDKEKFLGKNFVRQFFLNIRRINTIDCENSGWETDYDYVIFESEDNYDGIKLKNIFDIFGDKLPNTKLEDYKGDTYAIYNPKNIKLADGTNTTFDGRNPDIRYEQGGMTWDEYVKTQFNEDENRNLPSDYFEQFEIEEKNLDDYPIILKTKNGLEYRKWKYGGVGVFDKYKMVAFADNGSIQVSPKYQKKGIGLELVYILKELNPKHRFGNMTPQGWNLMRKYYDTKISNNPDIRYEQGGNTEFIYTIGGL